jgi:hypothetical protein
MDTCFVYEIQVAKEFQRNGLGTALMCEAEKVCRVAGCEAIALAVHSENGLARKFYRERIKMIETLPSRPFASQMILYKMCTAHAQVTQNTTQISAAHTSSSSALILAPAPPCPRGKNCELALAPQASSTLPGEAPPGGTELARASQHSKELEASSFAQFKCSCPIATRLGVSSCLEQFSKVEMRAFYHETYYKGTQLSHVSEQLHHRLWELKVPLSKPDSHGHTYHIPKWTLNGREVCKRGWRRARGGTQSRVRTLQRMVMKNVSPAQRASASAARLELALVEAADRRESARHSVTTDWWATELKLHDWLPNEQAIRFRGQGYGFLHEHVYWRAATEAGIRPLSYKAWMKCVEPALLQIAPELPGSDPAKLKLKRSANHSNFPECQRCQELRKEYHRLASTPGADPALVKQKLDELLEHQREWSTDRKVALKLKYSTWPAHSDCCYECDDKCGSFWLGLPVDPTGRDNKGTAKAKYHFAVQCNVIVGPGGVQRFAIVPKNVSTGANFGLSNFVAALHRAWKAGRLGPRVTRAIRHTDGGPDNVCWVSHLLHWLLVYIGAFDELMWFRFEAGHSHTEIADRLFAVMKKLFESDTTRRVGPVEDFRDLEQRLQALFAKSKEVFEMAYHFANWDFEGWFNGFEFDTEEAFLDKNFGGYSFDHVFKYTYVGPALWQHGGVQVLYKHRLSYTGSAVEAEWNPIRRTTRSRPTSDHLGTHEVQMNETIPEGVIFVQRPPDLRREPLREDLDQRNDDQQMEHNCTQIRSKRSNDLSEESMAFWDALRQLHSNTRHAGTVPDLPHTASSGSHAFDFHGCPQPLIPLLKDLMRFPRPLITWDLFAEKPPPEFQDKVVDDRVDSGARATADAGADVELRDPRQVNNVTHKGYTETESRRDAADLQLESWFDSFEGRVETVKANKLYVVALDEADGEFKLGLVATEGAIVDQPPAPGEPPEPHIKSLWFKRRKSQPTWEKNPAFEQFLDGKARISDMLPTASFLLEVADADLTDGAVAKKWELPKFKETLMKKLRLIADLHNLCERPKKVLKLFH